ncbi:hypothetical protein O181_057585 [Austropuccinia psidii MF-1]|uniref:Uncharacterized protein n=1 Tax=Austropuccinia psidii MF-1 TaxID=1389203 RepID=A0A9Q3HX48_9BASI|nr:hypothetical protein [Austropuccinia psidii MF-1]
MLVMLANKHIRNACSLSDPSKHPARGVPAQDTLTRTPLWPIMMKVFPSVNGPWYPKQADRNNSGQLALSLQASICPPPLLGYHLMVTSLLDRSEIIIRPMKDADGALTFKLGPIVTMSCHPYHTELFPLQIEQNPPNPPQQDSPVQCMPCEQTLWQPTPEPSQNHEPPIPGPSPSSKPCEDVETRDPEPEVAPTHSMEEPCACPTATRLVIIIDDTPFAFPPPFSPSPSPPPATPTLVPSPDLPPIDTENPTASSLPVPRSSHSYNDTCQEFTDLRPTLRIPQAINQILLEHHFLLHIIPFVDATHQNEMHREFREELNSLLGQALGAYPKEEITGIVSKYLEKKN